MDAASKLTSTESRLERWRAYCFGATLALALLLAVVVFIGPRLAGEPYLDWLYFSVAGGLVAAGTAFTLLSFRLGSLHARQQSAPHSRSRPPSREQRSNTLLRILLGAGALAGNVVAAYASGHPRILEWLLAVLVGALILLIRYRAMYPKRNQRQR